MCTEFKTLRLRDVQDLDRLQQLLDLGDGIHEFPIVLQLLLDHGDGIREFREVLLNNVLVLCAMDELAEQVAHVHVLGNRLHASHKLVDSVLLHVERGVIIAGDDSLNVLRRHD